MDNPEKLATQVTQEEEKQNKNNTICARHHYAQITQITYIRHKTTGGKDEPNIVFMRKP